MNLIPYVDPIASLLGEWVCELNAYSILLRIAIAFLFAAVIGCERARKRHSAGLRTFILVSTASSMPCFWISTACALRAPEPAQSSPPPP